MLVRQLLFLLISVNLLSFMRFGSSATYVLYFLKFIIFIALFCSVTMAIIIARKRNILTTNVNVISMLFYIWFIIMILGISNSASVGDSVFTIISYMLLFIFCFILAPNYIDDSQKQLTYLKVFYWSILVCIVLSIFLGVNDIFSYSISPVDLRFRYQGFFNNPNRLGLFSFLGIVCSIGVYILTNRKAYLFSLPLYCLCIYLSDSRAALLSSVFLVFLFSLFYLTIRKVIFLLLTRVFILTIITASIIGLFFVILNFVQVYTYLDQLLSSRISIWKDGINELDSPYKLLFGEGLTQSDVHIDNYYVVILTKTGWMGLLFLILILITVYKKISQKYKFSKKKWDVFIVSLFLTLLGYSFLESILFTLGNITSLLLWSLVGIYLNQKFTSTLKN